MSSDSITVLGAGSWGTALAIHLAAKGNLTCLWGHEPDCMQALARERRNDQFLPGIAFPDKLHIEADLSRAIRQSRDVLIVVPSHAFREVLQGAAPALEVNSRIAWASLRADVTNVPCCLYHLSEGDSLSHQTSAISLI